MPIVASQRHLDDEAEGDRELELVALTYVGSRSVYNSTSLRTQGQWPSYAPFQRGDTKVGWIPDAGLGYFEKHADFEVEYGEEAIAEALLAENYLDPQVFSAGRGGKMRQRTLDALGIDQLPTTAEGIREALADVAGEEVGPGEESSQSFVDRLSDPEDGFSRKELKATCKDLREDSSDVSLNGGKLDFAEYLAELAEGDDARLTESELLDHLRSVGGDA
jgi:hypothetical protein